MDHKAYESQMIDTINQKAEETAKDASKVSWSQVVTSSDTGVVARGLKRTILALLTAALFVISVIGFITVARATGYLAVLLFFASIFLLIGSFTLLYAQGIVPKMTQESKGERK